MVWNTTLNRKYSKALIPFAGVATCDPGAPDDLLDLTNEVWIIISNGETSAKV